MIIIWILKCIITFFFTHFNEVYFSVQSCQKGQKKYFKIVDGLHTQNEKKNFFKMNSIVVKRFDCLICIIYCGMMIAIKCQLSFISQSKLSDVISFHPSKKSIWVGWVELHFAFFFSRLTRGRWDVRQ